MASNFSKIRWQSNVPLTNLEALYLRDTQVADAGLEHLSGLTNLQRLSLDNTQVTDAGLEHLRGLTNLRSVSLYNTAVTDAGERELRSHLPHVTVFR